MSTTARYDVYSIPHRGLRRGMFHLATRLGATSFEDAAAASAAARELRALLDLAEHHARVEDEILHPLLKVADPELVARLDADHEEHHQGIEELRALAAEVEVPSAEERLRAGKRLYARLGRFIARDLEHMAREEDEGNAVLWRSHDDEALHAVTARITASLPPPVLMGFLGHILPALPHVERVSLLSGIRTSAPPPAFAAICGRAREVLEPDDWSRLAAALAIAA